MRIYKFLFVCALVVAICCVMFVAYNNRGLSENIMARRDTIFHVDTVTYMDTTRITDTRIVAIISRDTIFMHDMTIRDSFFVDEQKVYKDSTYTAWVSGINATLDSIETYNTHSFITQTVTERVFVPCDGLFAGVGVVTNGERFSPSIGLNYTKKSFLYSADIGVMDGKPLFMLGFKYKIK